MKAIGLPTISECPITTTSSPFRPKGVRFSSSTEASAVQGARSRSLYTMLPILAGCIPSTSFSGWIDICRSRIDRCSGTGRWMITPVIRESEFIALSAATISARLTSATKLRSSKAMPQASARRRWLRT